LKQWMKFMGRKNLILCINIIWVKNGGHTCMWCNNIFNWCNYCIDVVQFNLNTISDFLGWKMNICIKKLNHLDVCIICCCQFFNLCICVCPICCMCIIMAETMFFFTLFFIYFSIHVVCNMPCGMVVLESIFIKEKRKKNKKFSL
jgi:hypothetical protein